MPYRRNIFAKMRTLLANERTLMAYVRGSLAMLGLSAFLFKFFREEARIFFYLAIVLAISSVAFSLYGFYKFFQRRGKIMRR